MPIPPKDLMEKKTIDKKIVMILQQEIDRALGKLRPITQGQTIELLWRELFASAGEEQPVSVNRQTLKEVARSYQNVGWKVSSGLKVITLTSPTYRTRS